MKKTALITGGTKGIGLGIAKSLLSDGYNVAITSRTDESANQIAKDLALEFGENVIGIGCDVRLCQSGKMCRNCLVKFWFTGYCYRKCRSWTFCFY